jgi:hypothetical protein
MKKLRRPMTKARYLPLGLALLAACVWPAASRADFLYTFEAPQFTDGQTTPIVDAPPNSGSATFTTSFTDVATPDGYAIANFQPNNLFSGESLVASTSTDPLVLTFNTPVQALTVDFALDLLNGGPLDEGVFRLTTPTDTMDVSGSNVGGFFQGGTLTFTTSTPFTTATLQGFHHDGTTPVQMAIDNLDLSTTPATATPEPASLTLLGLGGFGLLGFVRRQRRTSGI